MWRLLLQAGLGFATFDVGRRVARLKRMAVFGAVGGLFALLGLGSLTAAGTIWLEPKLGAAGAAAAVGGGLLAFGGLIAWAGTWRRKPKAPPPLFDRVRSEVGAAGAAFSSARDRGVRQAKSAAKAAARDADDVLTDDGPRLPPPPGARRKKALNIMLFATLAGVILGRRL